MIGIEPIPEPGTIDARKHGLMLPVPGLRQSSVLLEPRDGSNIETLTAVSVRFQVNGKMIFRCSKVRICVYITDARVAFACSKYDKGGGWIGTPGAMLVMNVASKSLAAVRRRGKMMVGQVRYPWIANVGSTGRQGIGSEERLVFDGKSDRGVDLRLTLQLPKGVNAAVVAAEIARRAARFRLASEPNLPEEKRAAFAEMTSAAPLPPGAKNIIQFHRMPSFHFMSQRSASMDPGLPAASSPPPPLQTSTPGAPAKLQLPTGKSSPGVPGTVSSARPKPITAGPLPDPVSKSAGRIVISLEDL